MSYIWGILHDFYNKLKVGHLRWFARVIQEYKQVLAHLNKLLGLVWFIEQNTFSTLILYIYIYVCICISYNKSRAFYHTILTCIISHCSSNSFVLYMIFIRNLIIRLWKMFLVMVMEDGMHMLHKSMQKCWLVVKNKIRLFIIVS